MTMNLLYCRKNVATTPWNSGNNGATQNVGVTSGSSSIHGEHGWTMFQDGSFPQTEFRLFCSTIWKRAPTQNVAYPFSSGMLPDLLSYFAFVSISRHFRCTMNYHSMQTKTRIERAWFYTQTWDMSNSQPTVIALFSHVLSLPVYLICITKL